jgi:hypothetical protein
VPTRGGWISAFSEAGGGCVPMLHKSLLAWDAMAVPTLLGLPESPHCPQSHCWDLHLVERDAWSTEGAPSPFPFIVSDVAWPDQEGGIPAPLLVSVSPSALCFRSLCSNRSEITETQTWSMAIVISTDYKDATNTQYGNGRTVKV